MKAKKFILDHLRKHGVIRTRDIVGALHITRQTAHQHLQELILGGQLVKEGATFGARYRIRSSGQKGKTVSFSGIRKVRDTVLHEFAHYFGISDEHMIKDGTY